MGTEVLTTARVTKEGSGAAAAACQVVGARHARARYPRPDLAVEQSPRVA